MSVCHVAWQAADVTADQPRASPANVRLDESHWRGDLSHGEPACTSNDERMIPGGNFKHFIFHGADGDASGKEAKRMTSGPLLERMNPEGTNRSSQGIPASHLPFSKATPLNVALPPSLTR